MQKSAIKQMLYGERGGFEDVPVSEEYRRIQSELVDCDDLMHAELSRHPKLLQLYEKTCRAFEAENVEACDCHYQEGFRFGFLLALDVLGWKQG
ncbi:MAG: hypothetical protein IJY11_01975 [Clostridia bacterium]|nr:hypothetical protein [Clostridia bacterium]